MKTTLVYSQSNEARQLKALFPPPKLHPASLPNRVLRRRAVWAIFGSVCALFHQGVMAGAAAAQLQVLAGHVPKAAAAQQPVGRLDAATRLDLAIGLPLRNPDKLDALLQQVYRPGSVNFRHYLAPEQFTAAFGPTEKEYQAVVAFATAHGLKVTGTHSNRTLVDVNGTVADIEKTFHVNLGLYQHPTQTRLFFAPDVEPSVELDTRLLAISGLDNFVVPHPALLRLKKMSSQNARPMAGSGSGGTYTGKDFRAAYVPGVSLTGAGQSVGLFELYGYAASDITAYEAQAGLPNVPLTNILIDGFNGSGSATTIADLEYKAEVSLDIEMTLSMAPGLRSILVYEGPPITEGPSPLTPGVTTPPVSLAHVNDVLNRMATDDKASQLSCSYGFDINAATQQIFQQFAAQGQSFFLACGDDGAFVGAVSEPADDPYITVVGGTTLTTGGPVGSWVSETTWNTEAESSFLEPGGATGGGISLTYPIPVWQEGISMTANQGSTTLRNSPDVAMVADNIWFVFEGAGSPVSGTSAASPLWAGFMALANQQGAATGQPPIGFPNPALYAIGKSTNYTSCFHDITTGNNTTSTSPNEFYAVAGYDLCTGWGTPTGSNLIQALLAPPAENLLITSPLGFSASGPVGGPFSVVSQTYSLTNLGSLPLSWSLINTSSWLAVSSTSGTLNPGGPADAVTVSLNSAASNSLIASYSANLWFSNLTDGSAQAREFELLVGNGGFETGDFTDWTYSGDTNDTFVLSADDDPVDGDPAFQGVNDWQFVHSGLYGAFFGETNGLDYISQTLPTIAGQQYLLSFWLTSVPYEGQTTPSALTVNWNGTTVLNQTNLGAFGWSNAQFIVSATSSSALLKIGAQDVPGALGLDDVSVQPLPALAFQSATQSAGAINFTWSALSGSIYQLQSTATLSPANWTNLDAPIPATNSVMSVSEILNPTSQQFYRLALVLQPR